MATTAMRLEATLEQAEEGNRLWEKIRDILDTVAFELRPFIGPMFTNHPDLKYLDSNSVREKTLGDSELRKNK